MMQDRLYALLVEDEPLVAMVASDALEELGFRVLEAASAARALELAKAHQGEIAFAMVDLGLPDRPGERLVSELRELHPTLPIIIASGKGAGTLDADVRPDSGHLDTLAVSLGLMVRSRNPRPIQTPNLVRGVSNHGAAHPSRQMHAKSVHLLRMRRVFRPDSN